MSLAHTIFLFRKNVGNGGERPLLLIFPLPWPRSILLFTNGGALSSFAIRGPPFWVNPLLHSGIYGSGHHNGHPLAAFFGRVNSFPSKNGGGRKKQEISSLLLRTPVCLPLKGIFSMGWGRRRRRKGLCGKRKEDDLYISASFFFLSSVAQCSNFCVGRREREEQWQWFFPRLLFPLSPSEK